MGFDVADQSTFGNSVDGQNIADGELGLRSAVHILSGVHTFGGEVKFFDGFVAVRVAELDSGKGSTSSRIVKDFSDDTTNVAVAFGVIESSESGGTDAVESAGLVDRALGVTLLL